ncbi:MAG: hypothetical protein ACPGU5_08955 [Lishizhenia sp.]
MKIEYRTKEEGNKAQEEAFLAMTGAERFLAFMQLCAAVNQFPISKEVKKESNNNLVLTNKR